MTTRNLPPDLPGQVAWCVQMIRALQTQQQFRIVNSDGAVVLSAGLMVDPSSAVPLDDPATHGFTAFDASGSRVAQLGELPDGNKGLAVWEGGHYGSRSRPSASA